MNPIQKGNVNILKYNHTNLENSRLFLMTCLFSTTMLGGIMLMISTIQKERKHRGQIAAETEEESTTDLKSEYYKPLLKRFTKFGFANEHKKKESIYNQLNNNKINETRRFPYIEPNHIEPLMDRISAIKFLIRNQYNVHTASYSSKNSKNFILPKQAVIEIVGLIKEYADYILLTRNSEYISHRRSFLKDRETYRKLCLEFFEIYSFALKTAKRAILNILVNERVFKKSISNYYNDQFFYAEVNHYTNLFKVFKSDKTYLKDSIMCELFEIFVEQLLKKVQLIDHWIQEELQKINALKIQRNAELSEVRRKEDHLSSQYAINVNIARLSVSDEMSNKYLIDDVELRYYMFTLSKKHVKNKYYLSLLEKVNGIELMSLGFV